MMVFAVRCNHNYVKGSTSFTRQTKPHVVILPSTLLSSLASIATSIIISKHDVHIYAADKSLPEEEIAKGYKGIVLIPEFE